MARVRYEAVFIRVFSAFSLCVPPKQFHSTAKLGAFAPFVFFFLSKKMGSTGQMEPSAVVLWRFPRVFVCFTKCCFCASCIFAAQGVKTCHSTNIGSSWLLILMQVDPAFVLLYFSIYFGTRIARFVCSTKAQGKQPIYMTRLSIHTHVLSSTLKGLFFFDECCVVRGIDGSTGTYAAVSCDVLCPLAPLCEECSRARHVFIASQGRTWSRTLKPDLKAEPQAGPQGRPEGEPQAGSQG